MKMKKIIGFIFYVALLCNVQAQIGQFEEELYEFSCVRLNAKPVNDTDSAMFQQRFIPNDTTPIITIHMDMHIWRTDSGTGNRWLDNQAYRDSMQMAVDWLNDIYANNVPYCLHIPGAQYIENTKVRFVIDTFYYYNNTLMANYSGGVSNKPSSYVLTNYPDRAKKFMYHFVLGGTGGGESSKYNSSPQPLALYYRLKRRIFKHS